MGKFSFLETGISDLWIIEPQAYSDNRGMFMETYNLNDFKSVGIDNAFVQDNHSKSLKGVLRGLHFQKCFPQAKLVRVIRGEVFDVAVDIRRGSPTFGRWQGVILSEQNRRLFYIPEGFAHGFLVLSDEAEFVYKCTQFYHPEDEDGIIWNDPYINVEWPLNRIDNIILSEKDKRFGGIAHII